MTTRRDYKPVNFLFIDDRQGVTRKGICLGNDGSEIGGRIRYAHQLNQGDVNIEIVDVSVNEVICTGIGDNRGLVMGRGRPTTVRPGQRDYVALKEGLVGAGAWR